MRKILIGLSLSLIAVLANAQSIQWPSWGIYNAIPPTLGNGQPSIVQLDGSGNLLINSATERYAITQTSASITTTSVQLIAANPTRKYLAWMNVGAADITCIPGSGTAVAGAGMVYQNSGSGHQGSSEEFPHGTPTSAFQCVVASGTSTMIVWEGM